MQNTIPPKKFSQRVQLPAEFVTQAESDARRTGLSLPTLLGLAARRGWQETLKALVIGEEMPNADRKAVGLSPLPPLARSLGAANRRKGGAR